MLVIGLPDPVGGSLHQGAEPLFAFDQLALGLPALGDVDGHPQIAGDVVCPGIDRSDHQRDGQVAAVLAAIAPFALLAAVAFGLADEGGEPPRRARQFGVEFLGARLHFLGQMEQGRGVSADHLLCLVAQHLLGAAIEDADGAVGGGGDDGAAMGVDQQHRHFRAAEQRPVAFLAVPGLARGRVRGAVAPGAPLAEVLSDQGVPVHRLTPQPV